MSPLKVTSTVSPSRMWVDAPEISVLSVMVKRYACAESIDTSTVLPESSETIPWMVRSLGSSASSTTATTFAYGNSLRLPRYVSSILSPALRSPTR